MKILFITYHYWPPHFGGELLISIERFESLVKRGHKVIVLTSGSPNFLDHEFVNGIEIFRSPIVHHSRVGRGFRRLLFPYWAVRMMQKFNFDIMHFAGAGGVEPITSTFSDWLVCKTAKAKMAKIVCVHSLADTENEMFTEKGFSRKLRKLTLNQMDAIVSVSPALHEAVKKVYPDSSFFQPCAIRDDIFSPLPPMERAKLRKNYSISENQIVISFLGSVGLRKGFDLLANAFLELHDKYPEWCMWIIGPLTNQENQNINQKNEVSELIGVMQKEQNVRFWGRMDDRKQLAKLLALSDIFAFPSRKEGMGIAPMEAMAAGTPVIISRIPGVTDLANIEGITGLYIPTNNFESLKSALIRLTTDNKLRIQMGQAAHQIIIENYGWEKHINEWEMMYTKLNHKE